MSVLDLVAGVALLAGGAFTLVAGIGLVRLPDVFMRMHASTKAGTLGAGLVAVAVALSAQEPGVAGRAIGCLAFLLMTGPVGAHLIGRAAARTSKPPPLDPKP
jgi:multicomponent Na+:H+ antiporter subunit G